MHIYSSVFPCLPFVSLSALFVTFSFLPQSRWPVLILGLILPFHPSPHPFFLTPFSLFFIYVFFSILYPYVYTWPMPLSCHNSQPISRSLSQKLFHFPFPILHSRPSILFRNLRCIPAPPPYCLILVPYLCLVSNPVLYPTHCPTNFPSFIPVSLPIPLTKPLFYLPVPFPVRLPSLWLPSFLIFLTLDVPFPHLTSHSTRFIFTSRRLASRLILPTVIFFSCYLSAVLLTVASFALSCLPSFRSCLLLLLSSSQLSFMAF